MRHHPHVTVRHNVVNQSSRNGAKLQLVVLHDTEGANIPRSSRDLAGLGNFFNIPAREASSTVAVDQDGNSARYVDDDRKAWAQAFFNGPSLSIEQIGHQGDDWRGPSKAAELHETARWIAEWNRRHGIPIRRGLVIGSRIVRSGVVQHRNLGALGGGHVDVSRTYPMGRVLRLAREHRKHI